MKNVLIISHTFPPAPGIGGRRWVKFAKYLKKDGYRVQVIAARNVMEKESPWKEDTKGLNVEYLSYGFPKVLSKSKLNLFEKLEYRFWRYLLMLLNRGNYYDRSFFWKKRIRERIKFYVMNHQVNVVIVTGAPFLLTYYVTEMKGVFPQVKFVADFRDLWTTDSELTSFSALNNRRVSLEKEKEKFVVNTADVLFTVADAMTDYFKSISVKENVYTLPNGYDPEEISDALSENKPLSTGLNLVFAGTLYQNLNNTLVPFFEALRKLKTFNREICESLHIDFYGIFPRKYLQLVEDFGLKSMITVNGEIGLTDVYKKIAKADACLLILNDVYNFSLSTKFCEYIGFRKEVIVVSAKGPTSDFVTDNNLGYWIDPQNAYDSVIKCLSALKNKNVRAIDPDFDVSRFSVPVIAKKLESIINAG